MVQAYASEDRFFADIPPLDGRLDFDIPETWANVTDFGDNPAFYAARGLDFDVWIDNLILGRPITRAGVSVQVIPVPTHVSVVTASFLESVLDQHPSPANCSTFPQRFPRDVDGRIDEIEDLYECDPEVTYYNVVKYDPSQPDVYLLVQASGVEGMGIDFFRRFLDTVSWQATGTASTAPAFAGSEVFPDESVPSLVFRVFIADDFTGEAYSGDLFIEGTAFTPAGEFQVQQFTSGFVTPFTAMRLDDLTWDIEMEAAGAGDYALLIDTLIGAGGETCLPFPDSAQDTVLVNGTPVLMRAGRMLIVHTVTHDQIAAGFFGAPSLTIDNGEIISDVVLEGDNHHFVFEVPVGVARLDVEMEGDGDADMYVKFGSPVLTSELGFAHSEAEFSASLFELTSEGVTFNNPSAGFWYVTVNGYDSFSSYSLTAYWDTPSSLNLRNGVIFDGVVREGQNHNFVIDLPGGVGRLDVQMEGDGDADMYVKFGSPVQTGELYLEHNEAEFTASLYEFTSENAVFFSPSTGRWYVTVNGYDIVSSYSIVATW